MKERKIILYLSYFMYDLLTIRTFFFKDMKKKKGRKYDHFQK